MLEDQLEYQLESKASAISDRIIVAVHSDAMVSLEGTLKL